MDFSTSSRSKFFWNKLLTKNKHTHKERNILMTLGEATSENGTYSREMPARRELPDPQR